MSHPRAMPPSDPGAAHPTAARARTRPQGTAELLEVDSATWRTTLDDLAHDVYHCPRYAAVDARRTGGRPLAFVYRDHEHVFLLPLVLRQIPGTPHLDAASAYGYPGPISSCPPGEDPRFWRAAVAALVDTLVSAEVVSCFVRLHPLLPARLDVLQEYGTLIEHGPTVAVDLTLSEEALWRGLRANHRRQITSATKRGLRVCFDQWRCLDDFVDAYHETMRHVDAAASYFFRPEYFAALHCELEGATHLVTADYSGEIVAGALLFECGGMVQYHLGATRTRHRDTQPMKAVMHRSIRWAQQRGNRVFHLGGGLGGRADSLLHFKSGFSDLTFPFHTWRVVTAPAVYQALAARAPSADDPLFFPAYRRSS